MVKYGKFEMPESIKMEESTDANTFARFVAEPFERGFGHTVGNALRRILLSSLEAPSIVSVRIEGVPHEYTAIEGVVEDMTHIVLNFKEALLRNLQLDEKKQSRETKLITKLVDITDEQIENAGGSYRVTLKDLMGVTDFEVVNPDLHIMTISKPFSKRVDIRVGLGRGYVPSERQGDQFEKQVDEIIIDSIYSPVRLVSYFVENTRVGQDTDYDRLILEVTTDGRVTPKEALTFAAQIGIQHFDTFNQMSEQTITFDKGEVESNRDRDDILQKLALRINEIELSVRSTNCLINAEIETIGELVVMPESEMLRFRNFGKKSLTEIKSKLEEMGLSLGMDLSRYGINRDNIKGIIDQYNEEKLGSVEV